MPDHTRSEDLLQLQGTSMPGRPPEAQLLQHLPAAGTSSMSNWSGRTRAHTLEQSLGRSPEAGVLHHALEAGSVPVIEQVVPVVLRAATPPLTDVLPIPLGWQHGLAAPEARLRVCQRVHPAQPKLGGHRC